MKPQQQGKTPCTGCQLPANSQNIQDLVFKGVLEGLRAAKHPRLDGTELCRAPSVPTALTLGHFPTLLPGPVSPVLGCLVGPPRALRQLPEDERGRRGGFEALWLCFFLPGAQVPVTGGAGGLLGSWGGSARRDAPHSQISSLLILGTL